MSVPRRGKRERNRAEMRNRILAAVREMVVHHGTTDFTMAELAEAASVSLVTPYNYFGSKAGLLFGLLDMEHARDEAGTRLTSQDRDGLELTRDFGESRVRFYLEDAALFRPVFDGIFNLDPRAELQPALGAPWIDLWEAGLRVAREAGDLAAGLEPHPIAHMLHLQFSMILRRWAAGVANNERFALETEHAIALVLSGVAAPSRREVWLDHLRSSHDRLAVHDAAGR
jgi:AcrR family transcriptional regulator